MTTPSLNDLYTSILSDLRNRLKVTTIIGKVFLNAFAFVQAAKLKLYYLNSAFIYKNIFPDTADPESLEGTLSRFGYVKLGRYRNAATAGEYTVEVTGNIGATIAPGTTYKSSDTSTSPDHLFILDSTYTFTSATGSIQLRALDLGPDARLETNDILQVTQPIANIDSFGTVTAVIISPLEEESISEYRERIIQAFQLESQGGAKTDYRIWALDAQGVRSVYPYVNSPGIIDLYVEANPSDSTDGKGTPTAAILNDVESVIEFDPDTTKPLNERGRRPMGAFQINFLSITVIYIDVVITNLSDVTYITSISDALDSFLFDIRPYVDGADLPSDSQKGFIYEADIYGIVRDILRGNATFDSLDLKVNNISVDIYEFTDGNIPGLNSVTNV